MPKVPIRAKREGPSIEELHSYLAVDRNSLDDAAEQQPMLYHQVAEAHVLAQAERDELKEEMARVDADVADRIRKELDEAQEKATVDRVREAVLLHKEHKQAYARYSEAIKREALIRALRDSFEQRSHSIHELVTLYGAGYFETVRANSSKRGHDSALASANKAKMNQRRQEARAAEDSYFNRRK